MNFYASIGKLTGGIALAMTLALSAQTSAVQAQTSSFVAANRGVIGGEVSELSHMILIQIPRPVVLDIGARERMTLTVPTLSEVVINGQKIAPIQTPVLISVEPTTDGQGAVVKAKGIMLQGKLVAVEAEGDMMPTFIVNKKEFSVRVKNAMNLGAIIGNGLAGVAGANILGMVGQAMGDPTGTNLANQITATGGLIGIMSGMFGNGGGKRIVELSPNSTHVLTIKNPAMIVAQVIQLNRELAAGNNQVIGAIASQIRSGVKTSPRQEQPQVASQPFSSGLASVSGFEPQASAGMPAPSQKLPLF